MPYYGTRRKVFISFYGVDTGEVNDFIRLWSTQEGVFTPRALGTYNNDDFINSSNPDYVMGQIREKHIGDSSVTIVLLGPCTHSRRYVDWEIKASLRQGEDELPNGLIGILLPSTGVHLPERFGENWNKENNCYARYHFAPQSAIELGGWIEDAFSARTGRSRLISNSRDMMKNNAKCLVCGITHPAG